MKLLGRELCAHLRFARLSQIDDRVLAQVVGDRLRGPLRIAINCASCGIESGSRSRVTNGARPRSWCEQNVLREIVDRGVEAHSACMKCDVHANTNCAQ